MGIKTKIEWCDATWNPVMGCTPMSQGCTRCFARAMIRRFAGCKGWPDAPEKVTLFPKRLEQPLHWGGHKRIFVCDMGDLFHDDVPTNFIHRVFDNIFYAPWHTFLILTKRPQRMSQFMDVLYHRIPKRPKPIQNVWLGISVENQAAADERREYLRQTPAAIKYVSYEPALAPVDWTGWEFVDQIISGGESGPKARPSHPDWHRATRDFCQKHSIAYFFKQHGEWLGFKRDKTLRQYIGADGKRLGVHEFVDRPHEIHGDYGIARVGKKRAGRLLDGREWSEFPRRG